MSTYVSATSCKYDPSREEYCADIETKADCETVEGCGWSEDYDECVNTCFMIQTQEECEAIERCVWDPTGGSETGGSETSGGGSCHEPFT